MDGIERLGLGWSEKMTNKCFAEVDDDGGGTMEFTEFSHVMSAPSSPLQDELKKCIKDFRETFLLFDLEVSSVLCCWLMLTTGCRWMGNSLHRTYKKCCSLGATTSASEKSAR